MVEIADLMEQMLAPAEDRLTLEQVKQHPYMLDPNEAE